MYEKYREAGLCVVPLKDGVPVIKWGQYQDRLPDDVSGWDRFNEYALVCGKVSGVVALDFDTNEDALITKIMERAGNSPVLKVGSKGFTAFYRYGGEKTARWGNCVELLSDKHLTTIPPSKHREKDLHYTWVGDGLIGADLPPLPDDFVAFMDSLFPPPVREFKAAPFKDRSHGETSLDDAASMLDYISPDCERERWIEIGMALRDEFGDTACGLWHSWSKGSSKYKAHEAQAQWRSFHKTGITIATLYDRARSEGWKPAPYEHPVRDTGAVDALVRKLSAKASAKPPALPLPECKLALDPLKLPGLIGDTVRWICSDAMFPQPMLALLNVLAFAGAVYGRQYASPINTRTNAYFVAVASTGAGKDHSRKKIGVLAEAAGLGQFIGAHAVISDTGLARALHKNPSQMLMVDEFGKFMQAITDKNAGAWNKKIVKLMMNLYSDSSSVYKHGDYANPKVNEAIVIHSPNLCIYGTTTEKEYIKALNKDAVESGELNRIIAIKVPSVERLRVDRIAGMNEDIVDAWSRFAPENASLGAMLGSATVPPEPTTVEWGDCDDLQWQIALEQDRVSATSQDVAPLWNRRHENIIKIAMIFAISRNKSRPTFDKRDFEIATEIMDCSIKYMAGLVHNNLAENDHERAYIEILEYIRAAGKDGVAKSALSQKFRKYRRRDAEELIGAMIEQDLVVADRVATGTKPVITYRAL